MSLATQTDECGPATMDVEALFREHAATLLRAAYRITGTTGDAEDVVQTVFLRLLKSEPELAPAPGSYLYRAAINSALDVVRKRKRSRTTSLDEPEDRVADPSAGPDRLLTSHAAKDALRAALGRLSPRAATIFSLRYFEGLSNQRIAEIENTSAGVIGVLLHRARRRLQKELQPTWGEAS